MKDRKNIFIVILLIIYIASIFVKFTYIDKKVEMAKTESYIKMIYDITGSVINTDKSINVVTEQEEYKTIEGIVSKHIEYITSKNKASISISLSDTYKKIMNIDINDYYIKMYGIFHGSDYGVSRVYKIDQNKYMVAINIKSSSDNTKLGIHYIGVITNTKSKTYNIFYDGIYHEQYSTLSEAEYGD